MSRLPRTMPGCDIRSLPLRPADAFLLTRIDGALNEKELAAATGLSTAQIAEGLDRLFELGAIHFGDPNAPRKPKSAPATSAKRPSGATVRSVFDRHPDEPPLYDPAELDEGVEIDRGKRKRILDVYYRLDEVTHYELLGVERDADKKQVKNAYYKLAPEFHPDKYFRKELGTYKQKIEAIFTRITFAHDVLTTKARRQEYDEYLTQTRKNAEMAAVLDRTAEDVAAVAAAVSEAASAAAAAASSALGRYASPPPVAGVAVAPIPLRPESAQARRETLARKLRGGRVAPSAAGARNGFVSTPETAVATLRSRYEVAVAEARRIQIERFHATAKAALDRKDYASAANAFRIAASLDPNDEELRRMCDKVQQLAAMALAEGYLRQAEYEASQDAWADAAVSYAKVVNGRPDDASAHERAAHALLRSSGSPRRAVDLARRAVELSPSKPEFHLTLAQAYAAAGLEKSAEGEIERAAQLAPDDPRIAELVAHVRHLTRSAMDEAAAKSARAEAARGSPPTSARGHG